MIKQALSLIFIRDEAKIPNIDTKEITVTEVRMSQDLKTAKAFVLPLGGKNANNTVEMLKDFSHLVRKVLSKKNYYEISSKNFIYKGWIFWLRWKNREFN